MEKLSKEQMERLTGMVIMEQVKFIHFRQFDQDGKVCTHGGITVGYLEPPFEGASIMFTVARCRDTEVFSRKLGRIITTGRIANLRKMHSVPTIGKTKPYEALRAFIVMEYNYDTRLVDRDSIPD